WFSTKINLSYVDYWVLVFLVVLFLVVYKKKKVFSDVFLLLSIFFLSLKYVRHIPFFAITAFSILPLYAESFVNGGSKTAGSSLKPAVLIFLSFTAGLLLFVEVPRWEKYGLKIHAAKTHYPLWEAQFLNDNAFSGNVLVDFDWGEYCIWKLAPRCRVSIDGRYKTVYRREFIDAYFSFLDAKNGWRDFLAAYPHDWLLIRKTWLVADYLIGHPDWVLLNDLRFSPALFMVRRGSLPYKALKEMSDKGAVKIMPIRRQEEFFH
ncbi:MAG: hypothetical protein ABH858_02880, partial [Candidatus Omnitrophota bacterium]